MKVSQAMRIALAAYNIRPADVVRRVNEDGGKLSPRQLSYFLREKSQLQSDTLSSIFSALGKINPDCKVYFFVLLSHEQEELLGQNFFRPAIA